MEHLTSLFLGFLIVIVAGLAIEAIYRFFTKKAPSDWFLFILVLIWALVFASALKAHSAPRPHDAGSQFTTVEKATYPVCYRLMADGQFNGSVWLLENGAKPKYVSATHCVWNFFLGKPRTSVWTAVHPDLKAPIKLTVEKYDYLHDIAIFSSDVPNYQEPLRLYTLRPDFETGLFMWGNSETYNWQLIKGEYLARVSFLIPAMYGVQYRSWCLNTVPSQPGCSGGAVMNTHGEVIGIIWGHLTFDANGNSLCIVSPSDYIYALWKGKALVEEPKPLILNSPFKAFHHLWYRWYRGWCW